MLSAGRALVLVDGIDEVPAPERERARGWLRDLLAAYSGNRWLVTSRPSAVRDDWLAADDFTELTLSPMNRAEVIAFVRRWHTAMLDLADAPAPRGGLSGIARFGAVTDLYLGARSSPLRPEEWTALAALAGLADLRIAWESLTRCPPGLSLPDVAELTLVNAGDHPLPDLERVPDLFPGLAILSLIDDVLLPPELDLTPLAGMELVAVHLPPGVPVRGEARLPAGVVRRMGAH